MAKKPALLDDVLALIPRKGLVPWFETLEPELLEELLTIRSNFVAGRLGKSVTKTGLARAISKSLATRGVSIGHSGVCRWLESAQA